VTLWARARIGGDEAHWSRSTVLRPTSDRSQFIPKALALPMYLGLEYDVEVALLPTLGGTAL